jgi:hypothetical protein
MLGDALMESYHKLKEIGQELADQAAFKAKFREILERGDFPPNKDESSLSFWQRYANFFKANSNYQKVNQVIQKKTWQLTLYAAFYDRDIKKELANIEKSMGYMPRRVLDNLYTLIRNRFIQEIQPYQITEKDIGKIDPGIDVEIHPVSFVEANRGNGWDMSGSSLDSTHYLLEDSKRMIALVDQYIEKMKQVADKQEAKVKAGQKLDEDVDFANVFTLKR